MNFRDFAYRTYRLRRLTIVCVILCGVGLYLSVVFGNENTFFANPSNFSMALAVWLGFILLHNVIFPTGWTEPLAMSLALIPVLGATPFIEYLLTLDQNGNTVPEIITLFSATCLAWFSVALAITFLVNQYMFSLPLGTMRTSGQFSTVASPQTVANIMFQKPNTDNIFRKTSPQDDNGFFTVYLKKICANATTFNLEYREFDFQAKILEQGNLSQKTQFASIDECGRFTSSVADECCFEKSGKTIYKFIEVHNNFTLFIAIRFWLQDYQADHNRAHRDMCENRQSPAIWFLPITSLFFVMARTMKRFETNHIP